MPVRSLGKIIEELEGYGRSQTGLHFHIMQSPAAVIHLLHIDPRELASMYGKELESLYEMMTTVYEAPPPFPSGERIPVYIFDIQRLFPRFGGGFVGRRSGRPFVALPALVSSTESHLPHQIAFSQVVNLFSQALGETPPVALQNWLWFDEALANYLAARDIRGRGHLPWGGGPELSIYSHGAAAAAAAFLGFIEETNGIGFLIKLWMSDRRAHSPVQAIDSLYNSGAYRTPPCLDDLQYGFPSAGAQLLCGFYLGQYREYHLQWPIYNNRTPIRELNPSREGTALEPLRTCLDCGAAQYYEISVHNLQNLQIVISVHDADAPLVALIVVVREPDSVDRPLSNNDIYLLRKSASGELSINLTSDDLEDALYHLLLVVNCGDREADYHLGADHHDRVEYTISASEIVARSTTISE